MPTKHQKDNFMNSPICLICGSDKMNLHFYPPNKFNGKEFHYYKCEKCLSLAIFPIPSKEDFDVIYGTNDHFYLLAKEKFNFDFKYKKYTYQYYQLKFLKEASPFLKGKKLLDYGCGNGYYIAFAQRFGIESVGIEFDKKFAELLRGKTSLNIFSWEEFAQKYSGEKFDIIHLGHILEHLPNPKELLKELKKFSHNNTMFIIDGPLENNACLSRFFISIFSKLKKRKFNEYPPQHLSFTNYDSQLLFFKSIGFKTIRYTAAEQYWPLPEKVNTLSDGLKYLLAYCSIHFSMLFKKHGNIFHFIGKFEN